MIEKYGKGRRRKVKIAQEAVEKWWKVEKRVEKKGGK